MRALKTMESPSARCNSLQYVYGRWCSTIDRLAIRYRALYNARHSCVSWHLMIGKNLLWCSTQFGHSVQVMLSNYGRWISGATDEDIRRIREAMAAAADVLRPSAVGCPTMRFVNIKSNEQLGLQAVHRIRERLVNERTAVINQIRGFLIEYGLPVKVGRASLRRDLPGVLVKR